MPIAWRDLALRLCRPRPVSALAARCYSFAARRCAKAFWRVPGIRSVTLRGGSLHRPVPAVSDIDLTLFTDEDLGVTERVTLLHALRRCHTKLKRQYPMLGEVLVLTPREVRTLETSGCSLLLLLNPQRLLCGPSAAVNARALVPAKARVAMCLYYYTQMLKEWQNVRANRSPAFHRARCLRYAKKLFQTCEMGAGPEGTSLSPIFSMAFLAADRLSARALAEPLSTELLTESASPVPEANADNVGWWLRMNHQFRGLGKIDATDESRIFRWEGKNDLASLELFFEKYLEQLPAAPRFPIVFSPAMAECRYLGLSTDCLNPTVARVPRDRERDDEWLTRRRANLFFNVRDRALVHYHLLSYHLTASAVADIVAEFVYVARLTLSLAGRVFTTDDGQLVASGGHELPRVGALLQKIVSGERPAPDRLVIETVDAASELGDWFQNRMYPPRD